MAYFPASFAVNIATLGTPAGKGLWDKHRMKGYEPYRLVSNTNKTMTEVPSPAVQCARRWCSLFTFFVVFMAAFLGGFQETLS